MIKLDELLAQVWPIASSADRQSEVVPLAQAYGRVLAQNQFSDLDVPQYDNSAMDGYAVRCSDFSAQSVFPVSQRIPAGSSPSPLQAGTAARIFTGAPIPEGADAILMQENAQLSAEGAVQFAQTPKPGEWIRRAGEDISKGQLVLQAGAVLDAIQIGLLASIGIAQVPVWKRLKVGVLVTGSELQVPGRPLAPGQIYNSNEFVWVGLLRAMNLDVQSLGIVPDNLQATVDAFDALKACDVVISSGGVSVGEEDHVKPAIEQVGELRSWKVAMKPGKPVAFGHVRRTDGTPCWFFGLPGNPVSSAVAFKLIVKPFLDLLAGRTLHAVDWRLAMQTVRADFEWTRPDPRREEFLRVAVKSGVASLFANQSSGVLTSLSQSSGLVRVEPGQAIAPGQAVAYVSYQDLMK